MSTEQPTLDDFADEQSQTPQGARYGLPTPEVDEARTDSPARCCLSCGREIDAEVARVAGDNNGCIAVCRDCYEKPDGSEFDTDSLAIAHWRQEERGY